MAEYIFTNQSNYGWGLTFNMTGKAPIVSKRIFTKLADAQAFVDDANDSAIEGLILSVIGDGDNNGAYFVESIHDDTHSTGTLKKIGADSSSDIESIKSDITTLQGNVTTLQSDVTTLQSDVAELQKIDHTTFIKGIKVNGSELTPTDQVVDITIDAPTYDTAISEDTKESTNAPQTKAVYDFVTGVKADLVNKISTVENFKFQVVDSYDELPKTEISLSTIYLVKNSAESGNNIYTEYLRVGEHWEILGELKFDPTELQGEVNGLKETVGNLETTLNGKISGLEERLTALTTRLDTAEGNITKNTEDIADIKGKIDKITSTGGEPNVIETIQLNGTSIAPINKTVNIGIKLNGEVLTPESGVINIPIDALTNADIDKAINPTQV